MLRSLLVAVLAGGVAAAAPVPKSPPVPSPKTQASFLLGTATVVDGKALQFSYTLPATPVSAVNPASGIGPRPPRPVTSSYQLESVKVTTADGKELTGDDLTKRLSEPVAAVRCSGEFDAEWRKLFAEDVLFVELNTVRPGGGVINPLGGGVVRPLPGTRLLRPVTPVEEVPEVKPVEKKEEKK